MKTAVISEQGPRPFMEDTHYLNTNFNDKGWILGGIYDGHGGKFAAAYAAEKLHLVFGEKISNGHSEERAFIESYEKISGDLRSQDSGTTAVNFLIKNGEIFTANAGDARALIIGESRLIQLTVDHRLDNPEERKRVEGMGAKINYPYVMRDTNGLMPTRTIGDEYFKRIGVIATPFVNHYTILSDDIVLIAGCDGLFDFMNNEEVADFSRRISGPKKLLKELKREVFINRMGTDNLTILAVDFRS